MRGGCSLWTPHSGCTLCGVSRCVRLFVQRLGVKQPEGPDRADSSVWPRGPQPRQSHWTCGSASLGRRSRRRGLNCRLDPWRNLDNPKTAVLSGQPPSQMCAFRCEPPDLCHRRVVIVQHQWAALMHCVTAGSNEESLDDNGHIQLGFPNCSWGGSV